MLSVAMHNYRETYGCYLSQCTITERLIDVICGNAQCIDVSVAMHNYRETYSVICGNAQLQRDVWMLSVAMHNYRETYRCYLWQCTITERRMAVICGNAQLQRDV